MVNFAPVYEPKPWQEPDYKNIDSDDDADSVIGECEEYSSETDERLVSDSETMSIDEGEISDSDNTYVMKNYKKQNIARRVYKKILQEEEFFPE